MSLDGNEFSSNQIYIRIVGVWNGLHIAWKRGWRRLILESDSTSVVALLTKCGGATRESRFVTQIQALPDRDWQVSVIRAFRKANHCANFLANLPLNNFELQEVVIFDEPPSSLKLLLQADVIGIPYPRKEKG
ncbi:uncharacterized protein LOC133297728 [Gastrolobium bilobum]|uniref:uncharacterized protein LOC133297728 n=1 Tax=Gastrolobium bilobum TaxID=150636 RepID=UPI002AB1CA3B|nr:uncharacterized protein LOC133297728 [Gastrolobium bilobum]